jgi:hypothetical protein
MIDIESVKEIVKQSKEEGKIVFLSNVFQDTPNWETFYDIFKIALSRQAADLSAPSTLTIDNSEGYTDKFDLIVSTLESLHPGNKIAVLSIIHFMHILSLMVVLFGFFRNIFIIISSMGFALALLIVTRRIIIYPERAVLNPPLVHLKLFSVCSRSAPSPSVPVKSASL